MSWNLVANESTAPLHLVFYPYNSTLTKANRLAHFDDMELKCVVWNTLPVKDCLLNWSTADRQLQQSIAKLRIRDIEVSDDCIYL